MEKLSRKCSVTILTNTYSIDFPTNGKLIDIEQLKVSLSKGTHEQMLFGRTPQSQAAYLTIDAVATFTILIPQLSEDLNVKNLLSLTPIDTKSILTAYEKEFYPWYSDWFKEINADLDKADEKDKKDKKPAEE